MKATGIVHEIGETMDVTEKFRKRELVIEISENPQYPEYVKFEAIQDKCSLFDELRTGDSIEVEFNLKGRQWTDKQGKHQYFNTLQIWKVNIKRTTAEPKPTRVDINNNNNEEDDDHLPF